METIKREISVDRLTADETVQIMIEGEFIVPDSKGDIDRLISQNAECFVTAGDISEGRLNFGGSAEFDIIYLDRSGVVEGMSGACPIEDIIVIEGISKDSTVLLGCNISNFECSVLNERKVAYKAVAEVNARVYDTYNGCAAENIEGLPQDNLSFCDVVYTDLLSKTPAHITLKEQIKIGREKPNIDDVIELKIQPVNISGTVGTDRLELSGELKLTLLYNGEEGGNPLEVYADEIPINGSIEVDGAEENMLCCPEVCVENVYYTVLADEDGESRVLETECRLCIYPNVFADTDMRILDDAYSTNKLLEIKRENIKAFRNICCNKSQCPVKQPIETDGADMLQIYCASGKVTVDNVCVHDDRTTVEGVLEVSVLYVTGSDSEPVCSFKGDIPFEQTLETRGSREGMNAFVNAAPRHIGFNLLSQREVEIRGMLSVDCIVCENTEISAVTDIEEKPLPDGFNDSLPSITVYIVKKGDTLWKLAKRFNTTVAEIATVNEIDDPDVIIPGQRLLILKGVPWEE